MRLKELIRIIKRVNSDATGIYLRNEDVIIDFVNLTYPEIWRLMYELQFDNSQMMFLDDGSLAIPISEFPMEERDVLRSIIAINIERDECKIILRIHAMEDYVKKHMERICDAEVIT